jgi:hypothetical protein
MMIVPKFEIPPLGTLPIGKVKTDSEDVTRRWRKLLTDYTQNEEHVKLVIHECFENLIWLQMFVLHTGLILPDAINGNALFSQTQATRCYGRIGEKNEHDDAPGGA